MTRSVPSFASAAAMLFIFTTTATFNPHVNACGVTTHSGVAFRASRILCSNMTNLHTLT
ncbi:hypothetical protein EC957_007400, partial [Mortierella hygrophila]